MVSTLALLAFMMVLCSCGSGILDDPYQQLPTRTVVQSQDTRIESDSPTTMPNPATIDPGKPWTVSSTPAPKCRVKTGVQDGLVNLRCCAGDDCGIITVLPEGTELMVLIPGIWDNVIVDDKTGWVFSKYIGCKP